MIKLDDGDYYLTKPEWCAAVGVSLSRYASNAVLKDYEQPDMLVWPEQGFPLWRKSRVALYWSKYNEEKERHKKERWDANNAKARGK